MIQSQLEEKIKNKSAEIAVIGLGYVGLPLAVELSKAGFSVTGIDTDAARVHNVKKAVAYILDVDINALKHLVENKSLAATSDFRKLKDADVIIICVPTPLKRRNQPNINYIKGAVSQIKRRLRKGQLIILESTTYPGTTDEVILPMLESTGLKCGEDFFLVFSPERIDPGNQKFPLHKIPKVVGGVTKESSDLFKLLYEQIIEKVVVVSSPRAAEMVKLLENTFRLVNIGLVNELSMMCHKMNLDIWEIIDAARSKPFGFMPFYPGPGVGGHCLDENENVFIKDKQCLKVMKMPDIIRYIQKGDSRNNIEILSFDPLRRKSVFRKINAVSARPYSGDIVCISTKDGRHLKVTDLHPMFVYNRGKWHLKYAKDLQKDDCIPLCLELPSFKGHPVVSADEVDLLKEIKERRTDLIEKIRVKPQGFSWRDYAKEIKIIFRRGYNGKLPDNCWEYLSDNVLPLKYFYALEELVAIDHQKLKLVTGRGPGYSEMSARITIDEDFCRLVGYYLSEGCYTKDKSARIRFSFNRSEKEYIQDVINILSNRGISSSVYESKVWHTSCIKVSSNLFGFLLYEVLCCGSNCYTMNIPERFFSLDKEKKMALLAGIFRGDGCVEHFFGKWRYRKNDIEYLHNVNTASISFFTSSERLFQQLVILLQDLNIVPTFRKRKYSLSIFGYQQLSFCKDLFAGRKKEIIDKYLQFNKNRPRNKTFEKYHNFATVKVKSVAITKGDWVYSIETEKPHTFVTSYGIAVHNCIPKDPLYLYWKAKLHGFKSRFIKLAADLNSAMPAYIVERLNKIIPLGGAKILVLGVSYKKDVKDLRKSPALEIIDLLKKNNAQVFYADPLIPYLKFDHYNLKATELTQENLIQMDYCLLLTDHSSFDYDFILE
ncbi:MAG: hypothetical protein A3D27_00925, partial [Omnitrophica WOR_2 bacterium RIFCSPHIGHO2_02_FULL_46_37]